MSYHSILILSGLLTDDEASCFECSCRLGVVTGGENSVVSFWELYEDCETLSSIPIKQGGCQRSSGRIM
jgi:hypothetical protein